MITARLQREIVEDVNGKIFFSWMRCLTIQLQENSLTLANIKYWR